MIIEQDRAVLVHYHLTDASGGLIDSSREGEPMAYLHGHGNLVVGVETALAGKSAGDRFDVVVSPEQGYGIRDTNLDVAIPLEAFPAEHRDELLPGVMFEGPHPQNPEQAQTYTVMERQGDEVHCSGNHPLAGVELHFNLEVLSVREATAEEITQGNAYAPGGDAQ